MLNTYINKYVNDKVSAFLKRINNAINKNIVYV